jgi:acyl-CoA thioester hydrolase
MDFSSFKSKITMRVRFSEVDMLGVCNNAVYISYFEEGRLEYMKQAGIVPENGLFTNGKLFFIVRNEINYRSHTRYNDELNIYTRVGWVKNSSFGFEHLVEKVSTGEIIADGSGVVVQVDQRTRKSEILPQSFIDRISEFEPDVKIIKN